MIARERERKNTTAAPSSSRVTPSFLTQSCAGTSHTYIAITSSGTPAMTSSGSESERLAGRDSVIPDGERYTTSDTRLRRGWGFRP